MKIRIRGLSTAIVITAGLVFAGQYANNSNGRGRGQLHAGSHSPLLSSDTTTNHHRGNKTVPSTSPAYATANTSASPNVDDDGRGD